MRRSVIIVALLLSTTAFAKDCRPPPNAKPVDIAIAEYNCTRPEAIRTPAEARPFKVKTIHPAEQITIELGVGLKGLGARVRF